MCGLAGVATSDRNGSVDENVLKAMRDVQTHRGPDDAGLYRAAGIGLGHRRLSIIDLRHGHQPMLDTDSGLALIYNGELYNFQFLRKELAALGATFESHSDTEVLLQAWRYWGEACLMKLVGMFAFAIWDARSSRLYLARDHLGIKPLYYALTRSGDFAFASELKGLLMNPGVSRKLDPQAIEDYLALGYVPDPKTIFRGAFKLAPGYYLSWSAGESSPQICRYWDVPFEVGTNLALGDATEQLRTLWDEAVSGQLVSDVPLGAFLSGGLDSSSVVASMCRISRAPVQTCAIGFDHAEFDETVWAKRVATHLGTRHYQEQVQLEDFALLDILAGIYDEPYADSSALPTYRVCELARKYVKVSLSGDGGDENFAGYRRYRWHWFESRLRARMPLSVRRSVFGALGLVYPKLDWAPRMLRAKTTIEALGRDNVEAYYHSVSFVSRALREKLYSANFKRELQGYDAFTIFRNHAEQAPSKHPLLMAQYLDYKTYLPGDILTKVDRASMAHSLEVRVPVLDHRLVAWASRLPPSLKIHKGMGKYVLKKAMEPFLPRDVVYRQKMGFSVPLSAWFSGPLLSRARSVLLKGTIADCGWFEHAALSRLLRQHANGQRDHSTTLWSLVMLDAFLRRMQQPITAIAPTGLVRKVPAARVSP